MGDKVTGEWRKLHNEELYDLYSSPNIIWVIKSRMRWAGHVARMGGEMYTGFWWGIVRERAHLQNPCVERRIILRCIFWEGRWGGWMDWIDLAQERGKWWALCKHGNEPSHSLKCGEFLD